MSTSGYHATPLSPAAFGEYPSGLGKSMPPADPAAYEMVGSSAAMQRLRLQVRRIGPHFRTVLVSGEPGCGKELAAWALHSVSQGAGGPFVVCQAATLGDPVIENTGAGDRIADLMNMAHKGTLFLDGIHEMPLDAQGWLLRVLRRQEWAQDGLAAPLKINLRMIASTIHDLRVLVAAGRFRQELYDRIATLTIALPPLRERENDIPSLTACFLHRFAQLYGKNVHGISQDAMERLNLYRWPGNIRELENVLRNAVLLSEGAVLESQELPPFTETDVAAHSGSDAGSITRLQDVVEQHVLQVLKNCAGNKLRAAEMLGISRSTLYRMLESCSQGDVLR